MLGMPHGLFFMAYIVLAVMLGAKLKWPNKTLFIALVAAIIPFGTFYINKKYLRNENT
jgi:integral membrane protein